MLAQELRELTCGKERPNGGLQGFDGEELLGGHLLFRDGRHPLLQSPFHPQESGAKLRLQDFANAAQPLVLQVVNIVLKQSQPIRFLENFWYRHLFAV